MIDVLCRGDESGNNMVFRRKLSSGREIFGLATENHYGGEWDLGPTLNYLVTGESPFLIDTGNIGQGLPLLEMIKRVGFGPSDLGFIILSHGHEDHDGGLSEIAGSGSTKIVAHETYDRLTRIYPDKAPSGEKNGFSASCWHCPMPKSFSQEYCTQYHEARDNMTVNCISGSEEVLSDGVSVFHIPGHSPDSVAIVVDNEVMFVGDTILPDITPRPTLEKFFGLTKEILPGQYNEADQLYGLRAYIRSLKKLKKLGKNLPDILVLPAHRLFYNNKWNDITLDQRVDELIDHHVQRCAAIIDILEQKPRTAEETARTYFEAKYLKGYGIIMAIDEIISHCELLELSGDVIPAEDGKLAATGGAGFESFVKDL